VRVRFVAADTGPATVVEAALDDFTAYDGSLADVGAATAAGPRALILSAPRPDPARGPIRLTLELPRAGAARVEVLDLGGRLVRTLHSGAAPAGALALEWDGMGERGHAAPAGLYFIRAICGGASTEVRLIRIE
jgi:hypothetical protein